MIVEVQVQNPYISIGQSGTVGSQGYNVNGIFMGLDSGTSSGILC